MHSYDIYYVGKGLQQVHDMHAQIVLKQPWQEGGVGGRDYDFFDGDSNYMMLNRRSVRAALSHCTLATYP